MAVILWDDVHRSSNGLSGTDDNQSYVEVRVYSSLQWDVAFGKTLLQLSATATKSVSFTGPLQVGEDSCIQCAQLLWVLVHWGVLSSPPETKRTIRIEMD